MMQNGISKKIFLEFGKRKFLTQNEGKQLLTASCTV